MKYFVISVLFLSLVGFTGIALATHDPNIVHSMPFGYPEQKLSPLKQFKSGVAYHEIVCNSGLQLTQRYDGSPACVRPDTYFELIKRDWVSNIIKAIQSRDLSGQDPTSSYMEKIIPTLDDFKDTIAESNNIETIFSKFGEPHDDIGSGIHIYVYELNDFTKIWIGYVEDIWYVRHVDTDGNLLEELFAKNSTSP
ncbi:MAG: hypothetical protein P8X83_01290 [Nitrosopumilaceae archaeon]|jgi:hypothetical protein